MRRGRPNPDRVAVMSKFASCPKGHNLPYHSAAGDCTPLYCAKLRVKPKAVKAQKTLKTQKMEKSRRGFAAPASPAPPKYNKYDTQASRTPTLEARAMLGDAVNAAVDDLPEVVTAVLDGDDIEDSQADGRRDAKRMLRGATRLSARRAYLKVPVGLEGSAAEDWATKRLVELVPDAVAEIEYQLKLGDDSQRKEAARDVLDAVGMRKTEKGGQGVSPVVFINFGGDGRLPWGQGNAKLAGALQEMNPSITIEGNAIAQKQPGAPAGIEAEQAGSEGN